MTEPTVYTAAPTYETLKAMWLGKAPTCGPTERYDREVNFEAWALEHGIHPSAHAVTEYAIRWNDGRIAFITGDPDYYVHRDIFKDRVLVAERGPVKVTRTVTYPEWEEVS